MHKDGSIGEPTYLDGNWTKFNSFLIHTERKRPTLWETGSKSIFHKGENSVDGYKTCAKPVKTAGSKQRYNFDKHDSVFSRGGYQVLERSGFSSACI